MEGSMIMKEKVWSCWRPVRGPDVVLVGSTSCEPLCRTFTKDAPHEAEEKATNDFKAECSVRSKLCCPNIAEYIRTVGELLLVMEKMDADLRTFLETHSKRKITDKLNILHQVSQGLSILHSQSPTLEPLSAPEDPLKTFVDLARKAHAIGMTALSYYKHFDERHLQQLAHHMEWLDLAKIEISFGRNLDDLPHWLVPHITVRSDRKFELSGTCDRRDDGHDHKTAIQSEESSTSPVSQPLTEPDNSSPGEKEDLQVNADALPECLPVQPESTAVKCLLNACSSGEEKVPSGLPVEEHDVEEKGLTEGSVSKESFQCEQVTRIGTHKNKTVTRLRKKNFALRKRLSMAKSQLHTAGKHSQHLKQANRSLTEKLENVRENLECCLNDRVECTQEARSLKLENARLAASMVDYETLKNQWKSAQLQMFQARAERDRYKEKSLELMTKLLKETEVKLATDREKQMLLRDYEALQRAYRELKTEKRSLLEEQVFMLDEYNTRLSTLQSEVVSLKDEHGVVKIHRDKFGANLRQFASEHDSLKDQFMSFAKELFESVQMKMVQSIDEYERLETAQDTVAEHVKTTTLQTKVAQNELRKLERETEHYRHKLTGIPCSVSEDQLRHVVPNIAAKWREFAVYLGVDTCMIRAVEAKHDAAEDRCKEIISRWREGAGKVPKTWATILEAMRLCGLARDANEIEETLCSE